MVEPPAGEVTLVFTDIEGSTKLLQRSGELYAGLLADHRSLLRAAFHAHNGYEVDTEGDAFFVVFRSARDAAAAAAEAQRALARHSWPDDWPVLDLGEHHLKDLLLPEHLFQLMIEGLPSEFPALKTLGNRPTNLPTQPNPLIGRDKELREILRLLRNDDLRLLALTGPGGAGKTRLALQLGAELLDEFQSGVFFVPLAPISDEDLVVSTIAQALAVREIGGEDLGDTLNAYLRDKQMLLVLDNFEQIVGAAPSVSKLLAAAPGLRILATSRERLHLTGEHVYEVPPLTLPDTADEELDMLLETDAIALFVARAEAAAPDFVLTQENAASVVAICRRLEGLPLALELAAARLAVLSPQGLLSRLDERLAVLTGGPKDADRRHKTLRSTLEWSYDLLDPADQLLFARLAVFVDGCRLDAAEAVCSSEAGDVTVLDGLQSLVDKSLVRHRPDSDAERRFWMLETIREYASERLTTSGKEEMFARRHVEHFLELAEMAEPYLWRQETDAWFPRLAAEQANFRAALDWALSHGQAEIAFRLAGALYPFWELRAQHGEARAWLDRALSLNAAVSPESRAKALVAAGRATGWQSDRATAATLLQEAVALCRKLDDLEGVGRCLGFIGHLLLFAGDSDGAAVVLDEGVELARRSGDARSLARAVYNAAFVPIEQGDFDRAREMFEEAIRTARAESMNVSVALATAQLGYTVALAGDYDAAANHLRESVALFAELDDTIWTQMAVRYQGLLALLLGDLEKAEPLLRTSLLKGGDQAPQQDIPYWIEDLAAVAAGKGEALRAATLWGATDALFERNGLAIHEENRQVRDRFRRDSEGLPDPKTWKEAWTRGHAMTLQEVVAYALSEETVPV